MEFGRRVPLKLAKDGKPICKYGDKCYRKHPSHWQEFVHPSIDSEKPSSASPKNETSKILRGKITDFFVTQSCSKQASPQRKKLKQTFEEDSDYSIEDPFENDKKEIDSKESVDDCSPVKKRKIISAPKIKLAENLNEFNEKEIENEKQIQGKFDEIEIKETEVKPNTEPCHSKSELTAEDIERVNELIEHLFLVKMPLDFFHFWNFCLLIKRGNPKNAVFNWLGFTLAGPFDVLVNNLSKRDFANLSDDHKEQLLCHCRYFFDVPEFQTVLKGNDDTGVHIGYFRDDPKEAPVFLASNESQKSCILTPIGDNLFVVIQDLLTKKVKRNGTNPGLEALQRRLTEFCKKHNISLRNNNMNTRNERVVAKPFHGAGLVVPFEDDVGYREIPLSNANLKKLFKRIIDCEINREKSRASEELEEIITLINYANDENDFGMGLELGIDLFCYGAEYFHSRIRFLLDTAYGLLEREEFSQIIRAHLKRRTKDVLDLNTLKLILK